MGRKNKASRSEQAANNGIARNQRRQVVAVADMPDATNYVRRRCTKAKPCLGLYAMESGNAIDTALPVTSVDPLASVEIHTHDLDADGSLNFTDAFYDVLDGYMPVNDVRKFAPFLAAGLTMLGAREPLALGFLRERYALKRNVRTLVQQYGLHHETIERQVQRGMAALRDCVLEAQRADVA